MPKRNLVWMALTVVVALLAVWLTRVKPLAQPPPRDVGPLAPLIEIHKLASNHYIDPVPDTALAGAIRGYLGQLGPYCQYVRPEKLSALSRTFHGQRCGLGLRYVIDNGTVRIVGAVAASPAGEVDIRPGDVLLGVDDRALVRATRRDVDECLDGPEGQRVSLLIDRAGTPRAVDVVRRVYSVETVTGLYRRQQGSWQFLVSPASRLAYVRIGEFAEGTGKSFDEAMRAGVQGGLDGLVLDLRDNPGGPLREAVEVADRFLASGLIVMTYGRDGPQHRHMAHAESTFPAAPVVVLVNGRTASAPEVVAGALKRHRRAVLVGTPTFGKNVIQQPFNLGRGMGRVMLTTARYCFSEPAAPAATRAAETDRAGRPPVEAMTTAPAGCGKKPARVVPDVIVDMDADTAQALRTLRYRMEVMPPRPQASRPADDPASQPAAPVPVPAQAQLAELLALDRQLAVAVELLKQPQAIAAILNPPP